MPTTPQPAVEAAIWLAFAPGGGHFTAVAVGPNHLLSVGQVSESASYVKLLRPGEQVRTATVVRSLSSQDGDLVMLHCQEELPHVLRLLPPDELRELPSEVPINIVGFRDCVKNALDKKAVVLHWTDAKLTLNDEGNRLSVSLGDHEAGGPVIDNRQRIVGIAVRSEEATASVVTVGRIYEHNRKWKIPLGPPAPLVAKAPTMAQSLALMHLVAAQQEEKIGSHHSAIVEHYRATLRLDPTSGAAHLGIASTKSLHGELDEEVFRSLGRACELLPPSEWSSHCADPRLANLLRSSKHLHGVVTALRADLKRGRPLAEWAALGRAVADLVHVSGADAGAEDSDKPRPPEKAAGRLLLWAGQPRSVIAIPSREQPDILRAAAFLLVDHPEQALFWLDDPQEDEEVESSRLETTQQLVLALRWIARCREGMYGDPLPREVAEKHAAIVGMLMPGGDVLSWHAHALTKAAHGQIEPGIEDLERAMRGLSTIALPGRWAREFPGLLQTPAELAAAFCRLVHDKNDKALAQRTLEKLPMAASDDAHLSDLQEIEKKLRALVGVADGVEVSPDRAMAKANREDARSLRLARMLALMAETSLPKARLGELGEALPVLVRLGFLKEDSEKLLYDMKFRARVRELSTPEQRNAALHDALEVLLSSYLDASGRERAELWPHVQETTKLAQEVETEFVPAMELLARVGNQRARELSYAEARELLEKASEIGSRASAPADLRAEIDMDLGWIEVLSGVFGSARERLERALNFYTEMSMTASGATPHRRLSRIHFSLARLATGTGDAEAALANACRSIEAADRGFEPGTKKAVQMYTSLVHLFMQLGDSVRARKASARIAARETKTEPAFD